MPVLVLLPQHVCTLTASPCSPCLEPLCSSVPRVRLASFLGKELTGSPQHCMRGASSLHLPTSPWPQEAVSHWRQGHVQWEGLCLPKLLPLSHQHQTYQDPRAKP